MELPLLFSFSLRQAKMSRWLSKQQLMKSQHRPSILWRVMVRGQRHSKLPLPHRLLPSFSNSETRQAILSTSIYQLWVMLVLQAPLKIILISLTSQLLAVLWKISLWERLVLSVHLICSIGLIIISGTQQWEATVIQSWFQTSSIGS